MKTTKLIILTMALGLMGLMSVGCSKSNSQSNNNNQAVVPAGASPILIDPAAPNSFNGALTTNQGGASVAFKPIAQAFTNFVSPSHPLNAPTNIQVNVNLSQVEAGRYSGKVTISYVDNGNTFTSELVAGSGRNTSFPNWYDNDRLESEYNYWFNFNNRLVFTAQFEDPYGAIVLSLEPEAAATTGHDAEPIANSTYKGTIYFKNFTAPRNTDGPWIQNYGGAPNTYERIRQCWFTYYGPYDCRSGEIQQKTSIVPGSGAGYQALGTFTGLTIKTAFNIN